MPKDIFSTQASLYAQYRPTYPAELYDFIYSRLAGFDAAWDCATGNGQVAVELAKRFDKIYATDISDKQLSNAPALPNILYSNQQAEHTTFADNTFDLITVGQALHWFKHDAFFAEVKRVLKPGGVFAAWMYDVLTVNPAIDEHFTHFYHHTTNLYWEPERKFVDAHYTNIHFPFDSVERAEFTMSVQWTLSHFEGYLNTWSATQKMIAQTGQNPVPALVAQLQPLWGLDEVKEVTFPVYLVVGF